MTSCSLMCMRTSGMHRDQADSQTAPRPLASQRKAYLEQIMVPGVKGVMWSSSLARRSRVPGQVLPWLHRRPFLQALD